MSTTRCAMNLRVFANVHAAHFVVTSMSAKISSSTRSGKSLKGNGASAAWPCSTPCFKRFAMLDSTRCRVKYCQWCKQQMVLTTGCAG